MECNQYNSMSQLDDSAKYVLGRKGEQRRLNWKEQTAGFPSRPDVQKVFSRQFCCLWKPLRVIIQDVYSHEELRFEPRIHSDRCCCIRACHCSAVVEKMVIVYIHQDSMGTKDCMMRQVPMI